MSDISDIIVEETPEYYDVIPEYNSEGRLCNYHTGEDGTARVMADEWERFNQLAGRQHEVIDGVVSYNENLEPCMPDNDNPADEITQIQIAIAELYEILLTGGV